MGDGMRERLTAYWSGHAEELIADDAVFHDLSSGQDFPGREAVGQMLHWFYNVAFDARAEPKRVILDEETGFAAVEGRVVGRHIGDFAGVPGTGSDIDVALCVIYALSGAQVHEAWVYFNVPEFMRQVGAAG